MGWCCSHNILCLSVQTNNGAIWTGRIGQLYSVYDCFRADPIRRELWQVAGHILRCLSVWMAHTAIVHLVYSVSLSLDVIRDDIAHHRSVWMAELAIGRASVYAVETFIKLADHLGLFVEPAVIQTAAALSKILEQTSAAT